MNQKCNYLTFSPKIKKLMKYYKMILQFNKNYPELFCCITKCKIKFFFQVLSVIFLVSVL